MIIIVFYLIPADFSIYQALFHAVVLGGVPKHVVILLQHQFALVGQSKGTVAVVACVGVGVPAGLVVALVHDQVAVPLHAQAGRT